MIRRVISGGQTGVDRAALDVALRYGMPCGGWCPQGRIAEDGPIAPQYPLIETPTPVYAERTAWNVRDSDGTLVLTLGTPTEGTAYTIELAKTFMKPVLVIDLAEPFNKHEVAEWLNRYEIRTLNVAGPRASKCPRIYTLAYEFLMSIFRENEA